MKYGLLALVALTLALACETIVVSTEPVEFRVENVSGEVMQGVRVGFPAREVSYGNVGPGDITGYRTVDRAYRYAWVQTVVEEDTLTLQPIDYVGETLLDGGRYTYRLGLSEGGSLTLGLVVD
jgi:hypothetical protein